MPMLRVRRRNDHLQQNYQLEPRRDASRNWRDLGGAHLVGTPEVAQDAEGKLVVVARAADGSLWEIQQTVPAGETWTDWRSFPVSAAQDPALHRDSQGKLVVYGVDKTGGMARTYQLTPSGDQWKKWENNLGGVFLAN
ncbi:hypothetical protein AB0H34_11620 [Saccharopolyspora shandongensis]|uniref:hypothetical protein n=1 Tax=Saccharopolyspora shandongensis TaxID=418495 RepID=UPI0033DEF28E